MPCDRHHGRSRRHTRPSRQLGLRPKYHGEKKRTAWSTPIHLPWLAPPRPLVSLALRLTWPVVFSHHLQLPDLTSLWPWTEASCVYNHGRAQSNLKIFLPLPTSSFTHPLGYSHEITCIDLLLETLRKFQRSLGLQDHSPSLQSCSRLHHHPPCSCALAPHRPLPICSAVFRVQNTHRSWPSW
ncbi:hypothetical protein F5883DRAFT_26223 [Diaporthe sp. PMI_573]|nr:hypothetical protein F5883DRAFT_26223 [Diaporthaceae sp. PMI_573]